MAQSRRTNTGVNTSRRGRPPKFGRPTQLVALTLPQDVLHSLRALHHDVGWAIVKLVESIMSKGTARRTSMKPKPVAELVNVSDKRSLIIVEPRAFASLRGVTPIAFGDGRAFLAFDQPTGLAELEVTILDKLEATPATSTERARLTEILGAVRGWRRYSGLVFRAKSIIVAEGRSSQDSRSTWSESSGPGTRRVRTRKRSIAGARS